MKRNIRDEGEVEPPPPVEPRPSRLGLDFLDMSVPFSRGSGVVFILVVDILVQQSVYFVVD